jgi:hypothetical protein
MPRRTIKLSRFWWGSDTMTGDIYQGPTIDPADLVTQHPDSVREYAVTAATMVHSDGHRRTAPRPVSAHAIHRYFAVLAVDEADARAKLAPYMENRS